MSVTLALPSKGRMKDDALEIFEKAGLPVRQQGDERRYRGRIEGQETIDVAFLSASEIARELGNGSIDLGVTGAPETFVIDAKGKVKWKLLRKVQPLENPDESTLEVDGEVDGSKFTCTWAYSHGDEQEVGDGQYRRVYPKQSSNK